MTKAHLQEWNGANICLPTGYCLCETPEDRKVIAEIWYDIG